MLKQWFNRFIGLFSSMSESASNSPTITSDSYPHQPYQIYNYHSSQSYTIFRFVQGTLSEKIKYLTNGLYQISQQTFDHIINIDYVRTIADISQISLNKSGRTLTNWLGSTTSTNYDNFQFENVNKQTGHLPSNYLNHPPIISEMITEHDMIKPTTATSLVPLPVEDEHSRAHFPPLIVKNQTEAIDHDFESLDVPCNICLHRLPRKVLIPCGHAYCNNCLNKLVVCPRCRSEINGVMKIYL